MNICPACGEALINDKMEELSHHFYAAAQASEASHIMWLNRYISKAKMSLEELTKRFEGFYDFSKGGIAGWIRERFVERFFSDDPNIFVLDMQKPSKFTIMGYVTEHYHFLKQWVKSCAYIIARTDSYDVQKYELDNISEEYFGQDEKPAHAELMLKMGESVGLSRERVVSSEPLPKTKRGLNYWERVSSGGHWLDAMVSMHALELIADRNVKQYGAKYAYFKPEILDSDLPSEVKEFLRAGYEADQYHSGEALKLVENYARQLRMEREVQSHFLRSSDFFYGYLEARSERGKMYEKEL